MKRRSPWIALLLAGSGSWAETLGCHEFHACGDRQCEPSHGGAPSRQTGAGGASPGGAPGRGGRAGQGGANGGTSNAGDAGNAGANFGGTRGGAPAASAGAPPSAAGEAGSAGATQGGAGGEGGAAGDAGAATCAAPFADCDESMFNGCESNLLVDVRNCGGCRARCAGACISGQCSAFETLAEEVRPPKWGGIVPTGTEVYALSNFPNSLIRWSEQQGALALFTEGHRYDQLVFGTDRMYLVGGADYLLSSIPRSGGVVFSEGITAKAAAMVGSDFYAVDAAAVPYWLSELYHEVRPRPLPAPLPQDNRVWLANDGGGQLALVAEDYDQAIYTVHYLNQPIGQSTPWRKLTSGVGHPAQVRVGDRGVYIDVVLPHDDTPIDDWQVEHELREVDLDGATRLVARLTGLLDFELVGRRLYLSVELPKHASVLRVVPLDDPERALEVQTASTLASLTYLEGYFYFGDTSRARLARMPAWLE